MRTPTAPKGTEHLMTSATWLNRLARDLVLKRLQRVERGLLQIVESDEVVLNFGNPVEQLPPAQVEVLDARFYLRLLLGGTVGAGESYADGDWDTPDLTHLVRFMVRNQKALEGLDGALTRSLKQVFEKLRHRFNANSLTGSRRNIAAHYDLSNDFFRLWLDSRMMYSSAVFGEPNWSLEKASEYKLQRLCELLELQPGDRLLEIGTGWGGLAIYAAENYDVTVTTATISKAQQAEALSRVSSAGLDARIDVVLKDYRDLRGSFDKIVSVEMVEAVGDQFVDGYFSQVASLLVPQGRFVMQAITIDDHRYDAALREVDFIKKHIFPGSFIPSIARLVAASARSGALKLTHLDDIGRDYATTLRCWSDRFAAAKDDLIQLGFDQRFQRLWQFYFSYCEGGFLERAISDVHMVFSSTHDAGPILKQHS